MRKRRTKANPISLQLHALDGARIRGGCDSCDAYQEIESSLFPNVHAIKIFHDGWCPVLARMEAHGVHRGR